MSARHSKLGQNARRAKRAATLAVNHARQEREAEARRKAKLEADLAAAQAAAPKLGMDEDDGSQSIRA